MSVGVTQTGVAKAALYCNTDRIAFGPVFENQYDAEEFLTHLTEIGERDPRDIPALELVKIAQEWEMSREPTDVEIYGAGV